MMTDRRRDIHFDNASIHCNSGIGDFDRMSAIGALNGHLSYED